MQSRPQTRRPHRRARRMHTVELAVAMCVSVLAVLVFAHVSAPVAVASAAYQPSLRAMPAEHVAAGSGAQARAVANTTRQGTSPSGGCQVSVHVSQTSSNGSIQQTSTSSSSGSCCAISVQSTQSSANGSNISVSQTTTQSCSASNNGNVHISQNGRSISVSQGGSSVTITQGGGSISVQSGDTSVHVSQNGRSISVTTGP